MTIIPYTYLPIKELLFDMVNEKEKEPKDIVIPEEESIFKILNHQIRRNIIKKLSDRDLAFTELKDALDSIDSPTLSYHLKNMEQFIEQKKGKYLLSSIGRAALLLLSKTDQSLKISKYYRNFWIAYIATLLCWIIVQTVISTIIGIYTNPMLNFIVLVFIIIVSVVNLTIIGLLRSKYK